MTNGRLVVTSVDPVTGEELVSGELSGPDGRGGLAFRAARGESLTSADAALAARIGEKLRALDVEQGGPVRARFEIANGTETLAGVEPAVLAPGALVRVLAERVRDGRLDRAAALGRLTPAEIDAAGVLELGGALPAVFARGLAASPGAATGIVAVPADFATESADPRILVVDDASPEDAAAIRACAAIIATSGGLTSDAAIAARALRKPCVVSTPLRLTDRDGVARGHWVTVDGSTGSVYLGALSTRWSATTPFAAEVVSWLGLADGEAPGPALARARRG